MNTEIKVLVLFMATVGLGLVAYAVAGFRRIGETKGGLLAFQLLPADMPDAEPAMSSQLELAL